MYILFQFTTYICIQDISVINTSPKFDKHSQPTYAYKIYPLYVPRAIIYKSHNLHMHTRYILDGSGNKITDADSQPTYAYKIYLGSRQTRDTHSGSQPTYAYKIYRGNGVSNSLGGTHNLHMHTRYIT